MSKQNFKSQMRTRSKLDNNKFVDSVCNAPTNDQLFNFAIVYLESAMMMPLTNLQKRILVESFTDPEVIRMWQLRHLQFQEMD